jgi:nickel-dependent lactate racemase
VADVSGVVRRALLSPLDFPPLSRAVVPGDRVVLALDRHTPLASVLVAETWNVLQQQGIRPSDVTILQPAALDAPLQADPRAGLAGAEEIAWHVHDPTRESRRAYLATTSGGERIYLARELVDADFVMTIGEVAFDARLGYRGTASVLYPGCSSTEAISRGLGPGQTDLRPDDDRAERDVVDEISWLLGVQFSLQVVASSGCDAACILGGLESSVLRAAKEFLNRQWRMTLRHRAALVVAAVEADASGHGWRQVGAALDAARQAVQRGGQVILLTEMDAVPSEGLKQISEARTPREALGLLKSKPPPDLVTALQVCRAAEWAGVYLLSKLPDATVTDLFLTPLASLNEAARLASRATSIAVIGGAQHVHVDVEEEAAAA